MENKRQSSHVDEMEIENQKSDHQTQEPTQTRALFLSGIIHEIRTPMNAIVGFSHLLKEITVDPNQLEYIHKIQEASQHLLEIVNDVLDVSKIESGKMIIEERPFQVDTLISSVVSLFQDLAFQKHIYLDVEKINVENHLIGDQARIKQILVNLLSNAITFTDQGGVSIVIWTEPILKTKKLNLCIKVKDTGIGMTIEQQQNLFQDYMQANRSTTRLFGGTGLGLSISQKLASLMNGKITVDAKPNEGSTFTLILPVGIALSEHVEHDNKIDTDSIRLRPGSRILLSEDNPLSLKLAQRILTNFGMIVDAVSNGKIAIEYGLKNTYELIILDLETPEMSGIDSAIAMRKHDIKIPILGLTAHQKIDVETECIHAGMNDVIQKPIDPKSLHKALIKWLPLS